MTEHENAKEVMLGAVFLVFCHAEIGTFMCAYAPERAVVSAKETAKILKWTEYRTRKAIKELVSRGWIERTSCGCPAIVSYGEYEELVCDAMPPINGFAMTDKGFETDIWKKAYYEWKQSMREWAEGGRK